MVAGKQFLNAIIWVAVGFAVVQGQSPVKLYYFLGSPPSRAVMVTLQLLNIPHELKPVNLAKGEHLTPEYSKMNPRNTVPVLDDNGFIVLDSHAINAYLVNAYGAGNNGDQLYPRNPKARSVVEHRLYFDTEVLFPTFEKVVRGYRSKTLTGVTPEVVKDFEKTYQMTEDLLRGHKFIAGNYFTIADISTYISLTSMDIILPANPEKFPLIASYMKRCQTDIPYLARTNNPGIRLMREYFSKDFNSAGVREERRSPRDYFMQRALRMLISNGNY